MYHTGHYKESLRQTLIAVKDNGNDRHISYQQALAQIDKELASRPSPKK